MSEVTPTSADAFRSKRGREFPITLSDGQTVLCRRPDLDDAMFRGVLPLPLVKSFFSEMDGAGSATNVDALLEAGGAPHAAELLDVWVCLAVKAPRIVQDEAESGPEALWIGELPLVDKLTIFTATFRIGEAARRAAAARFSG